MDGWMDTVGEWMSLFHQSSLISPLIVCSYWPKQCGKLLGVLLYIVNVDMGNHVQFCLAAILHCIVTMRCIFIGSNIMRCPRKPGQRLLPWATVHRGQHCAVWMWRGLLGREYHPAVRCLPRGWHLEQCGSSSSLLTWASSSSFFFPSLWQQHVQISTT